MKTKTLSSDSAFSITYRRGRSRPLAAGERPQPGAERERSPARSRSTRGAADGHRLVGGAGAQVDQHSRRGRRAGRPRRAGPRRSGGGTGLRRWGRQRGPPAGRDDQFDGFSPWMGCRSRVSRTVLTRDGRRDTSLRRHIAAALTIVSGTRSVDTGGGVAPAAVFAPAAAACPVRRGSVPPHARSQTDRAGSAASPRFRPSVPYGHPRAPSTPPRGPPLRYAARSGSRGAGRSHVTAQGSYGAGSAIRLRRARSWPREARHPLDAFGALRRRRADPRARRAAVAITVHGDYDVDAGQRHGGARPGAAHRGADVDWYLPTGSTTLRLALATVERLASRGTQLLSRWTARSPRSTSRGRARGGSRAS